MPAEKIRVQVTGPAELRDRIANLIHRELRDLFGAGVPVSLVSKHLSRLEFTYPHQFADLGRVEIEAHAPPQHTTVDLEPTERDANWLPSRKPPKG